MAWKNGISDIVWIAIEHRMNIRMLKVYVKIKSKFLQIKSLKISL